MCQDQRTRSRTQENLRKANQPLALIVDPCFSLPFVAWGEFRGWKIDIVVREVGDSASVHLAMLWYRHCIFANSMIAFCYFLSGRCKRRNSETNTCLYFAIVCGTTLDILLLILWSTSLLSFILLISKISGLYSISTILNVAIQLIWVKSCVFEACKSEFIIPSLSLSLFRSFSKTSGSTWLDVGEVMDDDYVNFHLSYSILTLHNQPLLSILFLFLLRSSLIFHLASQRSPIPPLVESPMLFAEASELNQLDSSFSFPSSRKNDGQFACSQCGVSTSLYRHRPDLFIDLAVLPATCLRSHACACDRKKISSSPASCFLEQGNISTWRPGVIYRELFGLATGYIVLYRGRGRGGVRS